MWLGDLLENVKTTAANGVEQPLGRDAFHTYLRTSLAQAKPYDQLAREILAGNGDSFADGPPNFWVRNIATMGVVQDTWDNQAAAAGEKFLGMQVNCTGCHNGAGHTDAVNVYLSTKTRMDFWKNAAFFAQTIVTTATRPRFRQAQVRSQRTTRPAPTFSTRRPATAPRALPVAGQSKTVDARLLPDRREAAGRKAPPRRVRPHAHGAPAVRARDRELPLEGDVRRRHRRARRRLRSLSASTRQRSRPGRRSRPATRRFLRSSRRSSLRAATTSALSCARWRTPRPTSCPRVTRRAPGARRTRGTSPAASRAG